MMNPIVPKSLVAVGLAGLLAGCSGTSEDVRVTFCKNMSEALVPNAESIEWTDNENTFRRPEYAVATLRFDVVEQDGNRVSRETACFFAYDAVEDTAQHLADPFSAYSSLPFAMTVDGRMLTDAELIKRRNDEQVRRGKAAMQALETGARDLAAKVRAGIAQ